MCGVVSFGDVFFALVHQWGGHTVGSTRCRYTLTGAGVVSFLTLLHTDNNGYSISVPI
jgi:hypothetical protein